MKTFLLCTALLLPMPALAQIAVSANDGKQLRPGEAPSTRTADSVSIIDIGQTRPKVLGTVKTSASMIGPPAAVAVARSGQFALVTAAQELEGGTIVKASTLSVIDLANPSAPKVIQTLQSASGASGVAINRAGTLALVAGTGDDAISIYTIAGKRLTPAGKVRLDYQSRPTDVAFSPDGKSAFAVAQATGQIVRLAVNGSKVTRTGTSISPGLSPYGVTVSRDGRYAYNTNLNGAVRPANAPRPVGGIIGTVSVLDLQTNTLVDSVEVGMTPEHVALSPDGKYLAVVVANGSAAAPGSPDYHPYGLLQIYRIEGPKLIKAGEAHSGAWCQGAAWSKDNRRVLLQCAMTKAIEVYAYDGTNLTRDGADLVFDGRPGAISTALDR
ncbi:MAG: YncE family protein [Sphingomonadales bacterium]|nr:YncE family protein [Sphingomonadales bacterium]